MKGFLTVSIFGGCGGLEITDFLQFLIWVLWCSSNN